MTLLLFITLLPITMAFTLNYQLDTAQCHRRGKPQLRNYLHQIAPWTYPWEIVLVIN